MSAGEAAKLAAKDEEIEIVTEFLLSSDLTTDAAQQPNRPQNPKGMTTERYQFVTQRLLMLSPMNGLGLQEKILSRY